MLEIKKYLEPSQDFNYDHPEIQRLLEPFRNLSTDQEKITAVYLKVRDGWRYDPYKISFRKEDYMASGIAQREEGHCIDKAIMMVTLLRGLNIPARLHLAKVTNHMAVERLVEKLGTAELTPHGMVGVYHNEQWVKASPTFNKELCERFGVSPLEFDGLTNSLLQPYNSGGDKFMEYLEDYGHFEDVPFDFILKTFSRHYPELYKEFREAGRIRL